MSKIQQIRDQFPALSRTVYGKPLVYLDNAATAQRPQCVLDALVDCSANHNANIHRAVHCLANEATDLYETARQDVAQFLNASKDEIVFTSGTSNSINLVANCLANMGAISGDSEIIVTEAEHHSNIVPWQLVAQRCGASIKVLGVDDSGRLKIEDLKGLITENTAIICVTHISNVLGIINPIKEIVEIAHKNNVKVLVDGAQGAVHCSVDVKDLDCDFYALSGHKIYAATGTGILYAKREHLQAMPPFFGGGEMISNVSLTRGTTYAEPPYKFEAGTQNLNAVPTLSKAIQIMNQMKGSREEQEEIKAFVYNKLTNDPRIVLYGTTSDLEKKAPLFSFTVKGAHHEDLALLLDKMGVAVRSGQMCAEPLMDRFGVTGMLRASFAPYNTMEEAEYFIKSLDKAIDMLM